MSELARLQAQHHSHHAGDPGDRPLVCMCIAESAEREARLLNTLQSSHLVVGALGSRFISIAIVADFARAQALGFALLFNAGWGLDQEYTIWHGH